MYDRFLTIEQNISMLAATPARLVDIIEGLSPAQLLTPPEPGAWSARDVLAHLRACADIWGMCIAKILDADRPIIKAVNPTRRIKQTTYREQEFHPSLQAFTVQRTELLALLQPLPPEAWSRMATLTGRASHANEPYTPMRNGWQTTNDRILNRLTTSSTGCVRSNDHRLSTRPNTALRTQPVSVVKLHGGIVRVPRT